MGADDNENGLNRALELEIAALRGEIERLRERDRKQRFLLDLMPFYVAYVDKDLRYQFNNRQYADWIETGNTDDLLGEEVSEVIGDDAMDTIQEHIRSALEGDEVTYDGVVRYKQGTRHIELRYVPDAVDADIVGFGAIIENRTSARKKDQRLREAGIVFEASRDSILVLNHRHQIVRVNNSFVELTGYAAEEALGKAPWNLMAPGRRDILDSIWGGDAARRPLAGRALASS